MRHGIPWSNDAAQSPWSGTSKWNPRSGRLAIRFSVETFRMSSIAGFRPMDGRRRTARATVWSAPRGWTICFAKSRSLASLLAAIHDKVAHEGKNVTGWRVLQAMEFFGGFIGHSKRAALGVRNRIARL